ncbi:SUMO-activating enzyme subunit 1 [Uranotaenia lowii]|uniref:SUMO-activating enzyme subunit 1 n=1 Tax=Uranotaenia lowii TaxID=190385 RepID=UPI0024796F61|nr:SUMO-activating enzyme subunit 1 [Uranotaenia lowii]
MVEANGIELTEHEAELYDRQIRLWGLDSQKRLRAARILIAGLNGLGAEIAKNVILSGVKAVTLLDDKVIQESDFCSQFLAPQSSLGTNRAEASLSRAQHLNPMVELKAETEKLSDKPNEYFKNFDVVCIIGALTEELLRIDGVCRETGIKFFAADLWGMFGYSFADLQEHNFAEDVVKHKIISKPNEKTKTELVTSTVKRTLVYPSYQALLDFDFKAQSYARKLKRSGPALPLLRVLQKFREVEKRDPLYSDRENDLTKLLKVRDELEATVVPDSALTHVFAQISPAAAIVGGAVAHEIIKTVSQKEAPHHNVFLFDPESCCGFIESIGGEA